MSFLLRLTLFLAFICVLIPTGNMQVDEQAQIDSTQAITLARGALSDARGFCERQRDACTAGGKIVTALLDKLERGARALTELAREFIAAQLSQKSASNDSLPSKAATQQNGDLLPHSGGHGTLSTADKRPSWQGPVPLPSSGQLPAGQRTY